MHCILPNSHQPHRNSLRMSDWYIPILWGLARPFSVEATSWLNIVDGIWRAWMWTLLKTSKPLLIFQSPRSEGRILQGKHIEPWSKDGGFSSWVRVQEATWCHRAAGGRRRWSSFRTVVPHSTAWRNSRAGNTKARAARVRAGLAWPWLVKEWSGYISVGL